MSAFAADPRDGRLRARVGPPSRSSEIDLGAGARRRLPEVLGALAPGAARAALLVDARVEALWGGDPAFGEPALGLPVSRLTLPAGEAAKEPEVLAAALDLLLTLRREEPVVVLGGGAALDLGGLAAALAHRGHPWVALPSTVLAVADASVGGKVAINHRLGKNLVGTFHPPACVLADLDLLATLPPREQAAGWAEVWKAGVVGDPALLDLVERGPRGEEALRALALAIQVKARLVEADERDLGPRRALNYGHTLGHALERSGLGLLHGEAVAVGMGAAARIAAARGLCAPAFLARQRTALARLGLPVDLPPALGGPEAQAALLERLGFDKKRRPGALHTFVLPRGGQGVVVAEDVSEAEVRAALGVGAAGGGYDLSSRFQSS